ncbi:hypothetical protein NDU88_005616 [Pleurodeles waltl]|uniref:Integrase catalytic domain-containing protein n=1 Tax=Pleurodeles waltl TaxID=8319 RepID=A0AAV7MDD8_PLEWA|nr:hypothetical protein NDU88_005616 [Pleurodeles waltl]
MGFPKEVVSDRGTNFTSTYMKSLWKECGVAYKFTTPYHPKGNSLVEIFNHTLKVMIVGLSEPLRRKWDVLLPCLLFAYRKVPQKGLGFSPFEFLYGHPVRGPLSLVSEGLEKASSKTSWDVFSYMLVFKNQMARFRKLAQENLEASQEDMKHWYDQNATLVEFQHGGKVNPLRVLHVNRVKPHFERTEVTMAADDGVEEESKTLPDLLSAKEKDGLG